LLTVGLHHVRDTDNVEIGQLRAGRDHTGVIFGVGARLPVRSASPTARGQTFQRYGSGLG
jgi:hypothetical protein